MTNKIIKSIAAIILTNFILVNFAFAQTSPTPPPKTPDIKVDPKKASDANKDRVYCEGNYRKDILAITEQHFSTVFEITPTRTGNITKCLILPQNLTISATNAGRIDQPPGSAELQAAIEHGEGISAKLVADAYAADLKARTEAAPVSKAIGLVFNAFLSAITAFILLVTATLGSVFSITVDWILQASLPDAITVGWTIVRDICNMFFILILIVIAIGTILRLKEYQEYGHLLGELVLMAILVNFSKVIATTLIDFVNVLISMFALHNWKDAWVILYRYINFSDLGTLPNGWMSGLVQGLSKFVFAFVGMATFLALTLMLVIRVVVLYLLIMLSPLAYALNILPVTHHYAQEWWQYFIKNLIWVPVSLFIMDIGILLAKSKQFTAADSAFNVILIMVFFWGAVIVAEHIGAAGGKMIANLAEKGAHMAWEATDMAFAKGATSNNRLRRGLSYLSVGAARGGLKLRFKKLEHEAYNQASAKRADQFSKVLSFGKDRTEFFKRAQLGEWNEEMKANLTSDESALMHGHADAVKSKNAGEVAGFGMKLTKDGNINTLVKGTTMVDLQRYVKKLIDDGVMREDDAMAYGVQISKMAEEENQNNFAHAFETEHGKVRFATEAEQREYLVKQSKKGNPQDRDRREGRLATGFDIKQEYEITDPETGNKVVANNVVFNLSKHGEVSIENISDYNGHGQTGNKETITYRMMSAAETTFDKNPEVYAVELNQMLSKNPKQIDEAYKMVQTTDERVKGGERLGWKWSDVENRPVRDDIKIREHIEELVTKKIITEEDFSPKGRLKNVGRFMRGDYNPFREPEPVKETTPPPPPNPDH